MKPNSKYLMEKTCKFHSNKNSFIYLDSRNKEYFNEKVNKWIKPIKITFFLSILLKDVIEIQIADQNLAYFSVQFINRSTNRYTSSGEDDLIFLNNYFAKKNKISEGECVKITNVFRDCSFANSITIGK